MAFYAALIISMLLTLALIPPLVRYAPRIGALDIPNSRKVHAGAIPRIGGIAMIFGSLIPLLIWLPLQKEYVSISLAVLVIFLFGLWDDRKEISYKLKFLGQLMAAGIIVFGGDIVIEYAPFWGEQKIPGYIACPFTILCLVAITNAMNLADGLDGLAGGTTLVSFGLIGVLCLSSGAPYILIVTMSVVGGVLGFLRFNSHPASIFMGDTGSQFLGLILGAELLLLTQSADIMLAKTLPLLIIGLPLVDTVSVMITRLASGRSPFSPDKNHIHHRLLKLGFSHYETVVILYLLQFVFVVSAFFTAYSPDWVPALLFVTYGALLTSTLLGLERFNISFQEKGMVRLYAKDSIRFFVSGIRSLKADRFLPVYIAVTIPCLAFYTIAAAPDYGVDVALLALLLAGYCFFREQLPFHGDWADRLTTYTLCACLCYLGYQGAGLSGFVYLLEWLLICVGGLLVFIAISSSGSGRFETSPYDVLLILLAFLIPYFTRSATDADHLLLDIVKFVVLLYVFEYAITSKVFERYRILSLTLGVSAGTVFVAYLF